MPTLLRPVALLLCSVLILARATTARAGAGNFLDGGFGVAGRTVTTIGSTSTGANAMALQADGKIVIVGFAFDGVDDGFAVLRYLTDGTLDGSFGDGGSVRGPSGSITAVARAVAVQADQKIVVVGYTANLNADAIVVRYLADGTPDGSFGDGGKVVVAVGNEANFLEAVVVQSDGNIVVGGSARDVGGNAKQLIARLASDGSFDPSFGSTGWVLLADGWTSALALRDDGKIVAAGSGPTGQELARLNEDGTLDPSFGIAGTVTTTAFTSITALAIGPDDTTIVTGLPNAPGPQWDTTIERYQDDGTLDLAFGGTGTVAIPVSSYDPGGGSDYALALAAQPDGKLVAAGGASVRLPGPKGSNLIDRVVRGISVVRVNEDGTLDSSFGNGGTAFTYNSGEARAVAVRADGKIVAAGTQPLDIIRPYLGPSQIALLQYEPDPRCAPAPLGDCAASFTRASLLIDERTRGKEKVQASLAGGPPLALTDFGDPTIAAGTAYTLCVYDDADQLALELAVERAGGTCDGAPCWSALGSSGFRYLDRALAADGFQSIRLKGGARTTASVLARNNSLKERPTLPLGIAAHLAGSAGATVQIVGSAAPTCLSTTLARVLKSDGQIFQAVK